MVGRPLNRHKYLKFMRFDFVLLLMIIILSGVGILVLYSASTPGLFYIKRQLIHFAIAFIVMTLVAQIKIEQLKNIGFLAFILCIFLLILVPIVGISHKGAQRWLSLGFFEFQPSELMKLALPMAISLYLSRIIMPIKISHFLIAIIIVVTTVVLIAMQPDLGTAIMIGSSGLLVIFFAGIPWTMIGVLTGFFATFVPFFFIFLIKDYQRTRIISAISPESDPLGSSYHIIQSKIAIGSGGLYGKGWLAGTQSQLEFLPERHTVLAEEFGFFGVLLLFLLYSMIVSRGLWIASQAKDIYFRLLASSISVTFFFYFFVNVAMVSGILPVVGLPLPLISYGGTSLLTMFVAFGILMSIYSHNKS